MNWDQLEKKLIAAARNHPPRDHVPYAFEQRVMAHLRPSRQTDDLAWWNRALWLGAGACTAIALLASVWSFSPENEAGSTASFSHGVEQTLFAAAEDSENIW